MGMQVPEFGSTQSLPPATALLKRRLAAALLTLGMAAGGAARADIYAFTDEHGTTHFSNVPADTRFTLLIAAPADPQAATAAAHAVDWLARSAKYDVTIDAAAKFNTLQPALVRAVIVVESGFNPRALSKKGAVGLMQLNPSTAKRYGVKDIYDPEQNIRAGAHYLKDLLARFGSNLELALAAYNAGEDAVERYHRHVPPYTETMSYVPNVMRVYQRLIEQARAAST